MDRNKLKLQYHLDENPRLVPNMKKADGHLVYSPSDLVRYLVSPFSSWLDRYYLENPGSIPPDGATEEDQLLARSGDEHERSILDELSKSNPDLVAITKDDFEASRRDTATALARKAPVIFQAGLSHERFAGYADFLILDGAGKYQVWDAKLARSVKPYYPVQLCCYAELLAAQTGQEIHEKIGVILGSKEKVELRTEDFVHYYRLLKTRFLALQDGFTGDLRDCPEPLPRADHGRWNSFAKQHFLKADHLVQVAGITTGQMKKLWAAGIMTVGQLAQSAGAVIPKLDSAICEKIAAQARLQCLTREARITDPNAKPAFELLPPRDGTGQPIGLATLAPRDSGDVYLDMEGYPLAAGGLEYLFGTVTRRADGEFDFVDWWAHDRAEEKVAFEGFLDWAYARWRTNPGMHIYHYAAYEVCAVRRLSTRHDTRQNEVDDLLRNNVFVDLYQIVRQSLRIGEGSYSIKQVERLYRGKRSTDVLSGGDSIVQYANWIEGQQAPDWRRSDILKNIRDYNEDDCRSAAELAEWLRELARKQGIGFIPPAAANADGIAITKDVSPKARARQELADRLRQRPDEVSTVLGDLVDFHRREQKPIWWRMFDRAAASGEELRDDPCCIEGLSAEADCVTTQRSLCQRYRFDPTQDCKLDLDDSVMFTHCLKATFAVTDIDLARGEIQLKIGTKSLEEKCEGMFPRRGSILRNEFVSPHGIPDALSQVATAHLVGTLHRPVAALLNRVAPCTPLQQANESVVEAAVRVTQSMDGGCLLIQGPPGTGKTYTAASVIAALTRGGKRVGIASNSHKAIMNLLSSAADATRRDGRELEGIKVGGDDGDPLFSSASHLMHVKDAVRARDSYVCGVVGGTAWLFTRPEWMGALDFLVIDEAGQVSLANGIAMARSAKNLILLGDQMQLEQPVQGSHPGDAGFSVLQYALKDIGESKEDAPVLHAVVPAELGLFLGESRRMHPEVCRYISDSIYEGRLASLSECGFQEIAIPEGGGLLIRRESGIIFSEIEHDGNVQRSDEEVERVCAIFRELLGRSYTDKNRKTRSLVLSDFLFIAPYNAQVGALRVALPTGARVGSVDKFQGQEAPVCVLSTCSSYGEYGSRGLRFILDRARINVAVSRAQCLAIVVGDPRIGTSAAGSIEEMALLNLFCKLLTHTGER